MAENRSKYEYMYSSMLGSRLAQRIPLYQRLAGSDPEVSMSIAVIETLIQEGKIARDKKIDLLLKIMNAKRMAIFATSEKTNEISKMAMQLPSDVEDVNLADANRPDETTP